MSFLSWGGIFPLLLGGDRIMELRHLDIQYLTCHAFRFNVAFYSRDRFLAFRTTSRNSVGGKGWVAIFGIS